MKTNCAHDVSFHDPDSHRPAGSPPPAAANRVEPEPAEGAAARGRPSTCTPAKLQAMCSFIRLTGLSDTAAAAMAGVKRSTLARWKQEDDEVELSLDQARFQYQAPRLAKIGETRMKDGQLDWRAQAWLVKFANPQDHGAPSRRRKLRDVEVEPEAPLTPEEQQAKEAAEMQASLDEAVEGWRKFHLDPSKGVITLPMMALMQQRRAIAIREMNAEKPAAAQGTAPAKEDAPMQDARPEDGPAESDTAASPAPAAEAAKSVTIRPEIHGLYAWVRPDAAGAPAPAMAARRRTAAMAG